MRGARIAGIGHALPARSVPNEALAAQLDTSDAWIRQRTGIETRRWVEGNVGPSELALPAAQQALAGAGISAQDLDLILFATLSPDVNFPGSSCLLQRLLDCPGVATMDIRNQCTGFVYGLATADAYVRAGLARNVLLVGAEVHSTGLDMSPRGRDVSVLFGDGAGAVVVQPAEGERRLIDHRLHADGRRYDILWLPAPASRNNPRLDAQMLADGKHFPQMDGRAVFKRAVEAMPTVVRELLEAHDLAPEDIDLLVPHQANLRINEMVARRLGLGPDKVFNNIQKYGNTTAATIPIALSEAAAQGRLRPGDLVVTVAFGAGLTWGANLLRW